MNSKYLKKLIFDLVFRNILLFSWIALIIAFSWSMSFIRELKELQGGNRGQTFKNHLIKYAINIEEETKGDRGLRKD